MCPCPLSDVLQLLPFCLSLLALLTQPLKCGLGQAMFFWRPKAGCSASRVRIASATSASWDWVSRASLSCCRTDLCTAQHNTACQSAYSNICKSAIDVCFLKQQKSNAGQHATRWLKSHTAKRHLSLSPYQLALNAIVAFSSRWLSQHKSRN